jgi:Ca2+-transporting ATPase
MEPPATEAELRGLTETEASRRLTEYGPNSLPSAKAASLIAWMAELPRQPVLLLLLIAAMVYFVLGGMVEGTVLIAFALFSISLLLFQERRSELAIAALKELAAPTARVRRNGRDIRLPSAELVPGDLVILDEGERIPADGELVRASHLVVDESLLTGESLPVEKSTGADKRVHGSTLVVAGHGLARLTETGARTEVGKLGASLAVIETGETHLQHTTGRLVRSFGVVALVVCTLLAVWYGAVTQDWLRGALSGIALGMAMLPEEFPVALAVFLAVGSWRLSQIGVLVRRAAAVEALGAITSLCVDKTGTLTENRMQLRFLDGEVRIDLRETKTIPANIAPLLRSACLASRRHGYDPMDVAIIDLAYEVLPPRQLESGHLVRDYALSSELLAFTQVWRDSSGHHEAASKGAPEAIAKLCRLGSVETAHITRRAHEMAEQGLRVLAVALSSVDRAMPFDDPCELPFTYLGLLAFEDPIRESVSVAVAAARGAGIKVKMITGDFPGTARAIARQAGIETAEVVTGKQLSDADDNQLLAWARSASVFARVRPEQKLKLVQALQGVGETVAMTGDGVNDAPALRSADVGIAMGRRGTDVAREAADIVLIEEDFGRIVDAIRLGRRIFDNLRKVIIYIAAIHVPIAGLGFLPIAFGLPVAIWPLHVVVLEMLVDSMCTLAFEDTPAETTVMQRPPRPRSESVASLPQIVLGLVQGTIVLAAAFGIYAGALANGVEVDVARTMALTTAILGDVSLVLTNARQQSVFERGNLPEPQPLFLPITGMMLTLLVLSVVVPGLRQVFQFGVPQPGQVALVGAASVLSWVLLELLKLLPATRRIAGAMIPCEQSALQK